ncbi:unnamed protein product [Ceratitis capitata]|uniref:(Mediterranean fruit fly) hypothetical protein n=1 Tax=Ceratitis capitata TaxID=7213 RepID=A0A811VGP2_CERCA|nr:unnamed protein product [Ceratitis capitata]
MIKKSRLEGAEGVRRKRDNCSAIANNLAGVNEYKQLLRMWLEGNKHAGGICQCDLHSLALNNASSSLKSEIVVGKFAGGRCANSFKKRILTSQNVSQTVYFDIPETNQSNSKVISVIYLQDQFKNSSGPTNFLYYGGPGWTFASVQMKTLANYGLNVTFVVYGI